MPNPLSVLCCFWKVGFSLFFYHLLDSTPSSFTKLYSSPRYNNHFWVYSSFGGLPLTPRALGPSSSSPAWTFNLKDCRACKSKLHRSLQFKVESRDMFLLNNQTGVRLGHVSEQTPNRGAPGLFLATVLQFWSWILSYHTFLSRIGLPKDSKEHYVRKK